MISVLIGMTVCLFDSSAWAQTLPNTPVIGAGLLGKSPDVCILVTVHSLTKFQGTSFYQAGVGWIVESSEGQLEVITPAHVVTDATQILIQCADAIVPAKVSAQSPNMDLAILKEQGTVFKTLQKSNHLAPLIVFKDRKDYPKDAYPDHSFLMNKSWIEKSTKNRWSYPYITAGSETETKRMIEGNQSVIDLSPLPGFASKKNFAPYGSFDLLVMETLAIHPGLSGVPLVVTPSQGTSVPGYIAMNYGNYVAGMITRTDHVGMRSLAISIDDVIRGYVSLKKSFLLDGDRPTLSYEYYQSNGQLNRHPILVQKNADGSKFVAYDSCDKSYQESSSWTSTDAATEFYKYGAGDVLLSELLEKAVKQNNRSITPSGDTPKISPRDVMNLGGGDYGESGGALFVPGNSQFNIFNDSGKEINGYTAAYKNNEFCKQSGVTILNGKTLVGYFDQKGLGHKIGDINDLNYEIGKGSIQKRSDRISEILRGASFVENAEASLVCRSALFADKRIRYFDGASKAVIGHHFAVAKAVGTLTDKPGKNYIQCDQDLKTMSISLDAKKLKFKNGFTSMGYDGNLISLPNVQLNIDYKSAKSFKGQVNIGGKCIIDLSKNNLIVANPWKLHINDEKIKAEINLDSKDRLFRLDILSISEDCLQGHQMDPWLDEFSVYEGAP
ncbi:serine protease [Bdellovibrio sp. SKB1291214]|uniref:serine protease n=1 Tax=Bdellovibrio sp. SKB1291214 TaxID=1732569 RepID=UPI00113002C4|nr:serine protease [Bdellovibrio sp. SKB1291214]UYL08096.1 serine protease [Bdellovibrio sp. SKB1291214]